MRAPAPPRRINPWIAFSVGLALAILAANGPRLYAMVDRMINPPPPAIIIIAPAGSDIV